MSPNVSEINMSHDAIQLMTFATAYLDAHKCFPPPQGAISWQLCLGGVINNRPAITGIPNFSEVQFKPPPFHERPILLLKGIRRFLAQKVKNDNSIQHLFYSELLQRRHAARAARVVPPSSFPGNYTQLLSIKPR